MASLQNDPQDLWNDFIAETYSTVRRLPIPLIPAESDNYAVIMEPRPHPHLEYALRNVMYFLGSGWGLQIFTSRANREFIDRIVRDWGDVHIVTMAQNNLTSFDYNRVKKTAEMWEIARGKTILWFESDCLLRRPGIEKFMLYDYVGAPWSSEWAFSERVRVGNGGLSLRKRDAMLDISRHGNSHNGVIYPEDVFFCINMYLERDRYHVAPVDIAREFAVETMDHPDPLGIHKIWQYLPAERVKELLDGIEYRA